MLAEHALSSGFLRRAAEQAEPVDDEQGQQGRHHRAFGIMEEVAVAQHRVAIGGRAEPPFGLLDQIFDDRAGLGDRALPSILDHRRLAERMDPPQRRRREHGLRVALVADALVGQAELLEQPEDALRAANFRDGGR